MKPLNRKVEYALMALRVMSDKGKSKLTTAKEVVELTGAPFDATARVMQAMAQRGLLKSEQGAYGGYFLTKNLSKVSLLDLVEIIEGPKHITRCLHEKKSCDLSDTCNLQSSLSELNRRLKVFYQNVTIKELIKNERTTRA